jgi:hypothetical protein
MIDSVRDYEVRAGDNNLPVPDPTRLTTQLVNRTIAAFREVFEVRFEEVNRAINLVTSQVVRVPADNDAARTELRADLDRQMLALREFVLSQIVIVRDVNTEKFQEMIIDSPSAISEHSRRRWRPRHP